jgi:hypothetical protein
LNTPDFAIGPLSRYSRARDALQWIGAVGLERHRGEEEAQRRFHILAMDAMILEVGEARAVINDREQHERRRRAALRVDPARRRQLLQVAWTEVEVPEVVGPLRLEPHGRGLPHHPRVIIAEPAHVTVEGGGGDPPFRQLLEPGRRLDPVLGQKLEHTCGRQAAAFLVGRARLQGGNDLAPALNLGRRHQPRPATIGPVRVTRATPLAQKPIQRRPRDSIEAAGRRHQGTTFAVSRR